MTDDGIKVPMDLRQPLLEAFARIDAGLVIDGSEESERALYQEEYELNPSLVEWLEQSAPGLPSEIEAANVVAGVDSGLEGAFKEAQGGLEGLSEAEAESRAREAIDHTGGDGGVKLEDPTL